MSTLAFLTESPVTAFIQSADNSVKLFTDEDSDEKKLEKQLIRVSFCMCKRKCRRKKTGLIGEISLRCNVWRHCQRCRKWRIDTYRGRLDKAIQDGPVRRVEADDHDAKNIVRKYTRDLVMNYPQDSDLHILFIATEDEIGEPVKSIADIDWDELTDTPEGRNVTGNLGKPPKSEPKESEVTVKAQAYAIEGLSEDGQHDAELDALEATTDLDPHTKEELEEALEKRDNAYISSVKRRGGKVVHSQTFYEKVDLDTLSWKVTSGNGLHSGKRTHAARTGRHKVLIQ